MYCSGERDRADFLAQLTLLQACYHVDAVLEKGTTITARKEVRECSGEIRKDVGQN